MTEAGTGPAAEPEVGGRSPLRIIVRTGADVSPALGPDAIDLRDAIHAHTSGTIVAETAIAGAVPMVELARTLGDDPSALDRADLLLLSVGPDVDIGEFGAAKAAEWAAALSDVIRAAKAARVRVIVFNGSTVVPDDHRHDYRGGPEPANVFVNRLDAALLQLSIDEGISIVDVDARVAVLGAESHVTGVVRYSRAALDSIRAELVRIIDDYGFFERRPLLPQRGRRAA